ncbi:MAG: ribosome biogenesis GTP-binding protein YihA/YsxC [Candidatus Comchoanobacterales bacterium]
MSNTFLRQATFTLSAPKTRFLPEDTGAEIAFVGRSNAGKSSTLNALCGHKIARTSKTPGRTQAINVFTVSENQRLIDLPGYGFAKTSLQMRQAWDELITSYLVHRASLQGIVIIMDIRHPLKPSDQAMIAWTEEHQIPSILILNKSDKLSKNQQNKTLFSCKKQYPEHHFLLCSSLNMGGIHELATYCCDWLTPASPN